MAFAVTHCFNAASADNYFIKLHAKQYTAQLGIHATVGIHACVKVTQNVKIMDLFYHDTLKFKYANCLTK